ncbi:MAG TPA: type II toxin-antitoxin system HicB family antitoxin [Nodularia sp. (in: cyanobacteria)]|nr:type II toxin-antitoxin system HicB family antitoxin [Nodularia sp. (in: cyanobacteria)]
MVKEFSVLIERESDGYFVASVPNLKGSHIQAKSLDELMERIQEAIELCREFENSEIGKSRFRQMEVYDSHQ